jgi:undecaprenyl-diphosphatase
MKYLIKVLLDKRIRKWIWFGVTALLAGSFLVVSSEVVEHAAGQKELIGDIDQWVLQSLSHVRTPVLNGIAVDVTALGSGTVLTFLVFGLSLFWIFRNEFFIACHLTLTGLGSALITTLMKSYFEKSRPDAVFRLIEVKGYTYPSGHSLSAAAIYLTIAIIGIEKLKNHRHAWITFGSFMLLIFAIGISRIYLGVHYFSDVMAGTLLGFSWACFLWTVLVFFKSRRLGK